jgi:hypothetical protein
VIVQRRRVRRPRRELADVSRRADNETLLAALPDLGVDAGAIVAALEAGRSGR